MSLAGITISIGILVDQAIVMTENATHHLKEHFGDRKVTGDTRELVIPACRTVGRPIFFSVLIMLLSFIPVFMLSGREGKLFHPLAFTKSFALIGVALISMTLVPALIPTFIKGRLRSEEENWIVRSFIHIYKPLLTWALPRRNLVMWMFAALLILAAGMFPLQAVIGQGASETAWKTSLSWSCSSLVTGADGDLHRRLALASYVVRHASSRMAIARHCCLAFVGVSLLRRSAWPFMPRPGRRHDARHAGHRAAGERHAGGRRPEGPRRAAARLSRSRIGHRQGRPGRHADRSGSARHGRDIRQLPPQGTLAQARAALSRCRPAGRADPRSADQQTASWLAPATDDDRRNLVNDATQKALERFDETMRELALRRYLEFEHELEPQLTRFAVDETLRLIRQGTPVKFASPEAEDAADRPA